MASAAWARARVAWMGRQLLQLFPIWNELPLRGSVVHNRIKWNGGESGDEDGEGEVIREGW